MALIINFLEAVIVALIALNGFQGALLALLVVWPSKIESIRKLLARVTE